MRLIAPKSFALRQRVAVSAPWVLSILVGSAVVIALYVYFIGSRRLIDIAAFAFVFLIAGGGVLGYAGWNIAQLKNGLIPSPKQPWQAEIRTGTVTIKTSKHTTSIPLHEIASVALVEDDSWDRIRGMEHVCLVLRLRGGARISIPLSTTGFQEVLAGLRGSHTIEKVSV